MAIADVAGLLPRIETGKTTTKTEIVELIKDRTGLHKSDVVAMLAEIEDTLLHFLGMGRSVKLEGIGTFSPISRRRQASCQPFRPGIFISSR